MRFPTLLGIELEIDDAGEDNKHTKTLLRITDPKNKRMYIKHNSSLNEGLELVTHPMSLTEQLHHFLWETLCKRQPLWAI